MANGKSSTTDQQLPANDDLIIDIYPRGYASWRGTAEQLESEGLIPDGFEWPEGRESVSWSDERFDYDISRYRPAGMKGPMSQWAAGDHWILKRTLEGSRGQGWHDAMVYEKQQELEKLLRGRAPGRFEFWQRYLAAERDGHFQDSLIAMGCKPPSRIGRPRKSAK